MRFLSVCSGIEAASVAWEPLGWKAVGFSEIEPFPCAVLAHRFPNTPNYGSLTEYASWPIAPGSIDLLVGGTPCQSFSVAGLRKGMADPRGNLALVFLGLADRVKPRWIVWENVPGVLSSNGGRDFGSFLGALEQLGYGWAYRVLDAQHFGVPQRRRRVFVVACLGAGGWESAAKVLFEPESLSGDPAKGRKKGQGVASDAQGSPGAIRPIGVDFRHERFERDGTVGTIQAKSTGGYSLNYAPGVAVPLSDVNLAASSGDHMSHVAIQGTIIGRGENAGPQGTGATECGPMFTLTKTDVHGVAYNVAPTVTSSGPPYSRTGNERVEVKAIAITFKPGNFQGEIGADPSTSMAVRRLTPTECMRLQGFPDDWARIPWKGKPADQCPDGPQYKAAGNSMAVPVMRWIGSRINLLK